MFVCCRCLQGVHIEGREPSPLFNQHDPYWEVHNDSAFAPQPQQYVHVSDTAMIAPYWLYNRTAWLLHSQVRMAWRGSHGCVLGGAPAGCSESCAVDYTCLAWLPGAGLCALFMAGKQWVSGGTFNCWQHAGRREPWLLLPT